ncbi:hypothetical protein [Faecalicoccus pleomorphus]|uniref:hypothetical protein n=1 Tax=Faecalicoccus pleomorphus TaxID=1323 RepID=UPI0029422560|nr:hypothetical protein [Faecalicoccus pleomorphus]
MEIQSQEKGRFNLTMSMHIEPWQRDVLNQQFHFFETFINDFRRDRLKAYHRMITSAKWKETERGIDAVYQGYSRPLSPTDRKQAKKECKPYYDIRNALMKEYGMSQFSFIQRANQLRHQHYDHRIGSNFMSTIGKDTWTAFEKNVYGNGKSIHLKRKGSLRTIAADNNKATLRILPSARYGYDCVWKINSKKTLRMPILIDWNNAYEVEAFQCPICFGRILKVPGKNKPLYMCQIVFKGQVPPKIDRKTGELKRSSGEDDVDVFIGSDTVHLKKDGKVTSFSLAPSIDSSLSKDAEIQKIDILMERSRRQTNPQYYNEDGTIKRRVRKEKRHWVQSKRYKKLQAKRRKLLFSAKQNRRIDHEMLANIVIAQGKNFTLYKTFLKAEDLKKDNPKEKRANKQERKYQTDRAPSEFAVILERKIGQAHCSFTIGELEDE